MFIFKKFVDIGKNEIIYNLDGQNVKIIFLISVCMQQCLCILGISCQILLYFRKISNTYR